MRLLQRLRLRGRVLERVVGAVEVDALVASRGGARSRAARRTSRARVAVSGNGKPYARCSRSIQPAPSAELDAAAGDVVDGRGRVREQARQAEGGGRDERAEAERRRARGEARRASSRRRARRCRSRSTARCSGRSGRACRCRAPRRRRRARTTAGQETPSWPSIISATRTGTARRVRRSRRCRRTPRRGTAGSCRRSSGRSRHRHRRTTTGWMSIWRPSLVDHLEAERRLAACEAVAVLLELLLQARDLVERHDAGRDRRARASARS